MQLSTLKWKPSAVLDIITADDDISCAGITQKGLPCGWDLDRDSKLKARNLLISMSKRSPREALDDLPQLARLCLCQKNHQKQAARVVAEWTALIESYVSTLERADTPRSGTESSWPELNLDEIIAELNALSIKQERLRSLLPDDHPARTSLSPNTTHRANQAELRESELLWDGQGRGRDSSSSRDGWKRVFGRGKRLN